MEDTLEQMQARHRKEQKELQSRVTNKKKNATKKTRKGVNEECAELERQLKARHEEELQRFTAGSEPEPDSKENSDIAAPPPPPPPQDEPSDATPDPATSALASQLAEATLSPPPDDQSQPGGKKRNRQKERLARRAAEQEAAAAAAETEAAGMIDHRGIEKAHMLKEFKAHSLREKDIEPDGHCLFSAVADQLAANGIPVAGEGEGEGQGQEAKAMMPYKVVRRTAAEYMQRHADEFAGFLEEPWESYVAKIRDTAEWGGQLELSALANAYGVEIRVVQDRRTEVVAPQGEEDGERKTLWLAYYRHGYGLGEHYNSLRKATA
ncbi:hypothetical protein B0T25DRAFT_515618 [Lasiosphaeria hispida]|uniref:OTU domain-containing protein n=1 Tax=Lasiosphaeria hispida TaxID=260671 RepID=A0AAJ0HS74_9PEZI|nr:hypothetical protein B0T25DRAFT_515618 [Lasiosphaeria hispida]